MHAKRTVGTRNRCDAKNELIRKRPKQTLLQNTITQSKHYPTGQPKYTQLP